LLPVLLFHKHPAALDVCAVPGCQGRNQQGEHGNAADRFSLVGVKEGQQVFGLLGIDADSGSGQELLVTVLLHQPESPCHKHDDKGQRQEPFQEESKL